MGMNKPDTHDAYLKRRTYGDLEDWDWFASGDRWTSVLGGSATAAVNDGVGGILTLSCVDSVQDREAYIKQTAQVFKFVNNQSIQVEAYLQYTEANTNEACVAFGLMSAVGAGSMQNASGLDEPKTNFSGAVIYKVPGGTQWKTCSSLGTTQIKNQSDTTAGGTAYTRLTILIEPVSSTLAEITYFVDGNQLKTTGGRPGTSKIKDELTYTGAVNMQLFACVKNGSTSPEVLNIDYFAWEELRALFTGF